MINNIDRFGMSSNTGAHLFVRRIFSSSARIRNIGSPYTIKLDGVWTTYVSYSGGRRENPSYEQVCTGVTGHAETVNVIYQPDEISLESLLKVFWECHDIPKTLLTNSLMKSHLVDK